MEWLFFIIFLIALGIWTKHVNTKHMRKLAEEVKKQHATPDNAHDSMGVAEMGSETLGEDNPSEGHRD